MKIKRLLIGMLASIALVGCSNEELIENGIDDIKKPQAELVRGDAYMNFAINTATNSSRAAVGGTTNGDNDGTTEDSGHKNGGTKLENKVEKILLVIAKADERSTWVNENNNNIELYKSSISEETGNNTTGGTVNNQIRNGYVGFFTGSALKQATENANYVSLASPIRLDYTGKYAVLVVVNPVDGLGITEGMNAKTAYEKILSYDGDGYTYTTDATTGEKTATSIQMSNKYACLIDATGHDTPDNPIFAEIKVERTVSKATWRWNSGTDYEGIHANLKDKKNIYPIEVGVLNYTAETKSFWYKEKIVTKEAAEGVAEEYYYKYKWAKYFNKATNANGDVYWVLFKQNETADSGKNFDEKGQVIYSEIEAIFAGAASYETYKGVLDNATDNSKDDATNADGNNDGDNKEQTTTGNENIDKEDDLLPEEWAVATAATRLNETFVRGLKFVYKAAGTSGTPEKYYVHLTHYALTNLSPSVYTVRHIAGTAGMRQFTDLGSSEYLYTPFYKSQYDGGDEVDFINSMEDVNTATSNFDAATIPSLFRSLPGSDSDGNTEAGDTGHDGKNVGAFMEYIYENSCKEEDNNPEKFTGIVLAGNIYDNATGERIKVLYQYNQKYYRTLQRLLDDNSDVTAFANLTPNSSPTEIENAGIEIFENGRCFYYSAGIKHYEYSSETPKANRYMEHAIMRNNIYSLAVTKIEGIGDARLNVTEDTPIEDIRSYVNLKVSILPWIVRFNDLNL